MSHKKTVVRSPTLEVGAAQTRIESSGHTQTVDIGHNPQLEQKQHN